MIQKEQISNRFLDAAQRRILGGFLVTFGSFFGCFWVTFGTFLEDVGAIWAVVGCPGLLWAILGVGGCWMTFGSFFGRFLVSFGNTFGALGDSFLKLSGAFGHSLHKGPAASMSVAQCLNFLGQPGMAGNN